MPLTQWCPSPELLVVRLDGAPDEPGRVARACGDFLRSAPGAEPPPTVLLLVPGPPGAGVLRSLLAACRAVRAGGGGTRLFAGRHAERRALRWRTGHEAATDRADARERPGDPGAPADAVARHAALRRAHGMIAALSGCTPGGARTVLARAAAALGLHPADLGELLAAVHAPADALGPLLPVLDAAAAAGAPEYGADET
ncbi:hypothetical protein AB0910_00325 [Streptomyces sp. NPDC047002]|uniref:hypothetical protein n=1 Tax=Streptomyces sp. NPDC047002 TaxID=3155475 RepID=UPI003456A0CC